MMRITVVTSTISNGFVPRRARRGRTPTGNAGPHGIRGGGVGEGARSGRRAPRWPTPRRLTALGVTLPAWGVLLVLSAINLSTMASITPANLGIYEASAVVAYGLVGLEPELAIGAAILQHVAYLIPMSGIGLMMMASRGGGAIRGLASEREAS